MQKPEKSAEPSMDEILASIRKIIAEEPTPADKPINQPEPAPAPAASATDAAAPPSADLSDILDEPTTQRGPAASAAPAEQGLTEWSFTSPASRGGAAPEATQPNPFSGQEPGPAEGGTDEQESPLVARLRDLATGGSGAASGEAVSAQKSPAQPTDAASADPIGTLAGSLGPAAPSADPQDSEAADNKTKPGGPAPAAKQGQERDGKDAAPSTPFAAAPSGSQPVPVSTDAVDADPPSPKAEKTADAPAPAKGEALPAGDKAASPAVSNGVADSLAAIAAPAAAAPAAGVIKGDVAAEVEPSAPELTIAEVLRPIVHQWLEENMPAVVERAIEKKLSERS